MLNRRQVLGGLMASGLSGCASDSGSIYNLFSKTITSKSPSTSDYPMSSDQIRQLPYATLGVRIADHPRAVLVLATMEGQELHWVSADRVSFYTSNGRLIRTHGLERDLSGTQWLGQGRDPLADFAASGTLPARGVYRRLDFKHADETGIAIESSFELAGEETVVILGREHLTRRIDEVAVVPAWRWKARNSFWIDAQNGRVWRSLQQYCPEMPVIETELLKPPAA
jgi:hypothetical protein